jgi:hypothetical protein
MQQPVAKLADRDRGREVPELVVARMLRRRLVPGRGVAREAGPGAIQDDDNFQSAERQLRGADLDLLATLKLRQLRPANANHNQENQRAD